MASKGPKRESLSRYFRDLDECESSSDESDDEINRANKTSGEKTNNLASHNKNRSASPIGDKPDKSEANSVTTNTEKNYADAKGETDVANKKSKLPSASECLSTRSNPTFLKLPEKKEVNWDTCQKRLDGDGNDADSLNNYKSNAIPPPSSYEPVTDPGIKVVDSEGRKRKTIWSDLEDQMTSTKAYKVHKDDDDNDGDDGS